MSLSEDLQKIPRKIIGIISDEQAYLFRIIPLEVKSNSILVVAVERGVDVRNLDTIQGLLRNTIGKHISFGAYITKNEMDEALEKYYP